METEKTTKKKEAPKKFRTFCASFQNSKNDILGIVTHLKDMYAKGIITGYEYILHDKDQNEDGTLKEAHTHFLWRYRTPHTISSATTGLGLPKEMKNFIQIVGHLAAAEEYLTHKNNPEKHQYSISEVHGNILDRDKTYQDEKEAVDSVSAMIADSGLTLREAFKILGGSLFSKNERQLLSCRKNYLGYKVEMPSLRINFYISGEGGAGKDSLAKMMAKAFFPDREEDDALFKISDLKAGFNGYDGQPCILFTEVRASDLISAYGRAVTFDMLDSHPKKTSVDVKYSTATLVNKITFLTGPDSYKKFLDGLSGEYVDKKGIKHESENKAQAYRRFPIVIELTADNMEIYLNMGWFKADRTRYEEYKSKGKMYIPGGIHALKIARSEDKKKDVEEAIGFVISNAYEMMVEKAVRDTVELPDDFGTWTENEDFDEE